MPGKPMEAESARDTTGRFVNKGVWEALRFAWGNPDFPLDRDSREFEEFTKAYWSLAFQFARPEFWERKSIHYNSEGISNP